MMRTLLTITILLLAKATAYPQRLSSLDIRSNQIVS